jgi:zinc transport system ATP-binding protein
MSAPIKPLDVAAATTCGHDHTHDQKHSHPHHPHTPSADALLSAHGLGLKRGSKVILEHIDLEIRPREIVTIIGPNGAGKTTLVRVLLGLMAPDSGHVHRKAGLRTGYAPQRFDLVAAIPMTVNRFLRLGGAHTSTETRRGPADQPVRWRVAARSAGPRPAA